jgi:hypothetical protein
MRTMRQAILLINVGNGDKECDSATPSQQWTIFVNGVLLLSLI